MKSGPYAWVNVNVENWDDIYRRWEHKGSQMLIARLGDSRMRLLDIQLLTPATNWNSSVSSTEAASWSGLNTKSPAKPRVTTWFSACTATAQRTRRNAPMLLIVVFAKKPRVQEFWFASGKRVTTLIWSRTSSKMKRGRTDNHLQPRDDTPQGWRHVNPGTYATWDSRYQ